MVVAIGSLDVSVAIQVISASSRPGSRTDPLLRRDVGIVGTTRNVGGAGNFTIVKFVDHKGFKGVSDGIEVINPAEPWVHQLGGNGETGVHDQGENKDCGGGHSL